MSPRYQPRPDPAKVYICTTSGSIMRHGTEVRLHEGQRLRGDHPVVQSCAEYFLADGEPVPHALAAVVPRHDAEQPPQEWDVQVVHEPQVLQAEDVRVLSRDLTVGIGAGRDKQIVRYPKGAVFRDHCELVTAAPDAFEPARGKNGRWR
jgi:hypothetical protein